MLPRNWDSKINLIRKPQCALYITHSLTDHYRRNQPKAKASRAHPRRRFTNGITATMGVSSSEEASPALVRTGKTLGTGAENSCVLQDACLGKGSPAGTGEQAGTGATAGFWPTGRGCSEVTEAATATGRVDSTHAVNGGSSRHGNKTQTTKTGQWCTANTCKKQTV